MWMCSSQPTWTLFVVTYCFFFLLAFVKSDRLDDFPGFKVKYVRGASPILKLLDSDRKVVENLSIDKWNTDAVVEFLQGHLKK